ncbi:MAG: tetratricopeptide repeat protein [Pseudomonadota bacterium]
MMLHKIHRQASPIIAALIGWALIQSTAFGQDAAWEGLINAGRNALQQQNFSEAERHFEAALETAENFPSGDPRLGKSYNNLAAVYYTQEDFERAEPLMRRALAQLRESLGPENTEVAQTMKNLAALYYLQGNRSEAEALLKRSLEILENVHGPNHAFVATVLSNLAGLYQSENRYEDAEPLLTRSLRIWESLLGTDHPDVVRSRTLLTQLRQGYGGDQAPGTATAAVNPQASLPVPAAGEPQAQAEEQAPVVPAPPQEVSGELEEAREALETLARLSSSEAENLASLARLESTDGVPVPALNPIGIAADEAASSDENEVPAVPPAVAGEEDASENDDVVTAALEPDQDELDAAAIAAASILNEATSADDVSFAVYLSTLWSIEEAKRYWQALQTAMPDILEGKTMEIEEVAAAGGSEPFYRVLTKPYASDPEAQEACEQIRSKLRTHDCSVVIRDVTVGG